MLTSFYKVNKIFADAYTIANTKMQFASLYNLAMMPSLFKAEVT